MEIRTVLLILLAALTAITIVFYQYFYKNPRKGSLRIWLAGLRFIAIFSGLLLLINPKFTKNDYFLEKSNLILLIDDSSSMENSADKDEILDAIKAIESNSDLNDRFAIQQYAFGSNVVKKDSLHFNKTNTDIANALSTTDEIFTNSSNAVVLFTDGNQTLGRDYSFINLREEIDVNPIIVGDTTAYEDLSVGLVNSNTYAFLKNKFPIEANILYKGSKPISQLVTIAMNGRVVYRENIDFSLNENSKEVNVLLEAKSVGVKSIVIDVRPLENEKNRLNNTKEIAIEVIDEKTNVTIVSDMLHPDIGALKKAIETNEQRSVTIVKPTNNVDSFQETDIFILYQPNRKFKAIYDYIAKSKTNIFTITGTQTDWRYLNQVQQSFFKENFNQTEEILPVLNNAFGVFGLSDFTVEDFPPLKSNLGDLEFKKSAETILFQKIKGVSLDKPLFSILAENKSKEAILFGENIWKWRAQAFRSQQSFKNFDDFIGKLMVYLASDNQKSRLELDYVRIFDNPSIARIRASYFDESYSFDSNADIKINVNGRENNFSRESPMLLKGSFFEVDLSDLEVGEYDFIVTVEKENIKRSGTFKILNFDPEKQLLSANYTKLKDLADKTNGSLYFPNDMELLISDLSNSERFTPIQKSKQNVVSLIDFRILLGIIVLTLSLEWFIRKFNGLI